MESFVSARIKLTTWYTIVLMVISIGLSVLYYSRTSQLLELRYAQLGRRFGGAPSMFQSPRRLQQFVDDDITRPEYHQSILQAELKLTLSQLLNQVMLINFIVLVVGGGGSYFLSGITLKPIAEALQQQKRFVADAAHELKTPLTALHTSLEVDLMNKKLNRETRKLLIDNFDEVKRLELLTDRLLKLAHAENNNQGLTWEKISPVEIVETAIEQVQPLADRKKVEIQTEFRVNQEMPPNIKGEREALIEVVVILLDNAIKYSKKDSQVKVSNRQQNEFLLIEVQDFGIGIKDDDLDKIFDRFYRSDYSRSKEIEDQEVNYALGGSYGLGLSLARQIVRNHQGTIEVESEIKKGSTFRVILPIHPNS